ncbi:MAG: PrgI family protein [Candidatus Zambryskibacteria bacterium]|nr:PrgI family protein [Candidatus Zambryskibacteria bacterium]
MQFQIPQFIDVEDKIFGPFTLKQFIYLAGGAAVAVVGIIFLGTFLGLLVTSPVIALAAALAFYKKNNRPFIYFLESVFKYTLKDKLYIWKKQEPEEKSGQKTTSSDKYSSMVVPNLSGSKLKDMNWELDVKRREAESLELEAKSREK